MTNGIRRFSTALTSPWAWADHSKLRVERRFDGRAGQPRAFLFADENGEVIPTVYFFHNRIHNSEPIRENAFKSMGYADVDELVEAGWRPYSGDDLDIPFGG
jgi:hypothetical protein